MADLRSDKTHAADVNACHQLMQAGRFEDAFARIAPVKSAAPDDIDVNTAYGIAALSVENWEAANQAQAFVDRMPRPDALRVLDYWAKMLATHLRFGLAKHVGEQILKLAPEQIEHYIFYCSVCLSGGQADAAIEKAEECVRNFPSHAAAWEASASVFAAIGDNERARRSAQKALDLSPDSIAALKALGDAKPEALTQDQLARLKRFIGDGSRHPAERAPVAFTLGDTFDRRRAFADAFDAYGVANSLLRAHNDAIGARYDEATSEARLSQARHHAGVLKSSLSEFADASIQPLFIVGMPRSGKTLFQNVLCLHDGIAAIDESPVGPMLIDAAFDAAKKRNRLERDPRATELLRHYRERLHATAANAQLVIDTTGENVWGLGALKALFPRAKFIYMARNHDDALIEVFFRRLSPAHPYSTSLADIRSYRAIFENAAALWRTQYADDFLDVSFDAFLDQPEKTLHETLSWLGAAPGAIAVSTAPKTGADTIHFSSDGGELTFDRDKFEKLKNYARFIQ